MRHRGACERLRRSRSRLPIAGRALRVVARNGEVFSATQAPCKPSFESSSIQSAQPPAPSSKAKDKPAPLMKKAEQQGQKVPTK